MEHNSLTGIACARPIIYSDGAFVSCYLDRGRFVPEEGLDQLDLLTVLNGEFVKAGSDLVEDFTLKCKLRQLNAVAKNTFEMDQFPRDLQSTCPNSNLPLELASAEADRLEIATQGMPLVEMSRSGESDVRIEQEYALKSQFERQVEWLMAEGEDFVTMETFSQFTDALLLLQVLKEYNVPSVVSFLARRNEPIAVTFSKIQIELDCLMFCLFQA